MTPAVETHFSYFSEIEEHYLHRRGGGLILSTLDWALIETWKDAGVPLEAVHRGIDAAFDRYDQRPNRSRKINSLAYCTQEVLAAAEEMKEAAVGLNPAPATAASDARDFAPGEIAAYCARNADRLAAASLPDRTAISATAVAREVAASLHQIAVDTKLAVRPRLEDLERRLTVLEEKLFAALQAAAPEADLLNIRAEVDRELQPYRSKMPGAQIAQLQKQYLNKRLLEKYNLPRISLFYL